MEEEAATGQALGIDFSKFLKKEEFEFHFMKLIKKFDVVYEKIDHYKKRLNVEIKEKGYEFTKAVDVVNLKVKEAMVPVLEDMQTLLRDKVRARADDKLL